MGVTRRMNHFDDLSLAIWFRVAAFGAGLIALGIGAFLIQLYISYRRRDLLVDATGDPWNGRTLEWSTSSPPPDYNFAFTPIVHESDAWWHMKELGICRPTTSFIEISMPANTGAGFVLAALALAIGFAAVWHMWIVASLSFAGLLGTAVWHSFIYDRHTTLSREVIEGVELG
jgi:cytochrome o ubiquinol oxidase subunit 1